MRLADGERREWIKPIMFSGGLGSIEDAHIKKDEAELGNDGSRRAAEKCFDQYRSSTKSWIDESCCCFCPAGMEVVKIGGPVYRIGVGGGAASSVEVRAFQTFGAHGEWEPNPLVWQVEGKF